MKKTISLLIITFFLLTNSLAYGEANILFSKVGIQPIHDKKKLPDVCLKGLKGENVKFRDFQGKTIFLNFWATWCGPCKEEMPSMEALYQQFKDRDFALITISVDYEGVEPVRKFIEKNRYNFTALVDPAAKTLGLFQINKIPTTFIIDKKRRIIGRSIGPRNWSSRDAFSFFEYLLDDKTNKVVLIKD
jgi:peroxiredoxin